MSRRRDWEASRARLLAAAEELFARRGYRGTSMRDVAAAAGVSEPTVFRHFPSKAGLFEAAVVEPIRETVDAFVRRRRERPVGSRPVELSAHDFYAELIEGLAGRSSLLQALTAVLSFEEAPTDVADLQAAIGDLFAGMDDVFRAEAAARGFGVNPDLGARLMVGMALSVTLHREWLFPGTGPPDREELVRAMTDLTVWGLQGRKPDL